MKFIILIVMVLFRSEIMASPIDQCATQETRNLLARLKDLSRTNIVFGHQYSYRHGVSNYDWQWDGPSDIFQISGDEPALVGTDYREIDNYENYRIKHLAKMIEVYERGGILTMSWHANNPVTGGAFNDRTIAVRHILPGGSHHEVFKRKLDRLADFFLSLRDSEGKLIPIIFRPWHEHNGNWFWWGKTYRTDLEYINLWRFTVRYLINEKHVHNVLYAYSPNIDRTFRFYQAFPGSDFVDIYGLDAYTNSVGDFFSILETVVSLAARDNKVPALTETGMRGLSNSHYWTRDFLPYLKRPSVRGLAYVMLWNNGSRINNDFFVPYVGHPSVNDFLMMKRDPFVLFQSNLPNMFDN